MKLKITIFGLVALGLLTYGLHMALVVAPTELTMGEVQRIFYYHVPSAWTAFLCFFANFMASIAYLVRRRPGTDAFALATAEVGVVFCTVVLVTGPLWARPVWGIWWTWDARLTTTLILWLIYVACMLVRASVAEPERAARYAAVIGVIGFLDVPIIRQSVVWWRTLHPGPTIVQEGGGTGLPPEMMVTLAV